MRFPPIIKLFGLLLMLFSGSMVPPFFIAFFEEKSVLPFFFGFLASAGFGFLLWLPFRKTPYYLKAHDGFLVVSLCWVVLSLFGALPFYIHLYPNLSLTNAVFESVSGLTTTGATILRHIDDLSDAAIYYRQQMHFLGGLGVIVLMVAVMPMLGVGGMQLYRAESVGSLKSDKLEPRMAKTAKMLWLIYLFLIVACALCYWLAGMTPFNALGESFSTVATGGFAMHNSSFSYYHSDWINMIAVFFMIMGATNFSLHFQFVRRRRLSVYTEDYEWMSYIKILLCVAVLVAYLLAWHHFYHQHHHKILVDALFTVVSLSTTTGFQVVDFSHWPTFVPYLLMLIAIMGGCVGSTAGGIKVVRCLLLRAQSKKELQRLIHPRAVLTVKLGERVISPLVMESVWGFAATFILVFLVLCLALLATGLDFSTAFFALAACISNAGASIGIVSKNFASLTDLSKWILILAMLIGRLEIFALLVLFTPAYWRR